MSGDENEQGNEKEVTNELRDIFGDSDDDEEDLGDVKHLDYASLPSFKKSVLSKVLPPVKRKKKQVLHQEDDDERPVRELTDDELRKQQVQQDVDSIMARLKTQKPKAINDLQNEVIIDETISNLMESMQQAANNDLAFNKNNQPAIAKLKLLPSVMEHLLKPHWFGALLDANILECIKFWLEPLADGSLPSLDIQKQMYKALEEYPIDTNHLRQSKVGRIVMFYTKCQRVDPKIQQQAQVLVRKWIRPILGKSADHHHVMVKEAHFQKKQARRSLLVQAKNTKGFYESNVHAFSVAPSSTLVGDSIKQSIRHKSLKSKIKSLGVNKK